jgi:SGNH hydrolase-like domain, acetyltransferase AlgX
MKDVHMKGVRLEREEAAFRELGFTRAGTGVRGLLIGAFVLTITAVPMLQTWREWRHVRRGHPPALVEFTAAFPRALSSAASTLPEGVITAVASANRSLKGDLHGFEQSLQKNSFLTRRFLPRYQWLVSRFLGLGNEKVFFGRDGWLYYRPDVDYLVGTGFSTATGTGDAAFTGDVTSPVHAGPIPALLKFRDDLALRGIRLIVVPVPVKPMIEPEHLSARLSRPEEILQNPSYVAYERELRSRGVEVLDLRTSMLREKTLSGRAQYLRRDTHWTPGAMEGCAGLLAGRLRDLLPGEFSSREGGSEGKCVTVRGRGDLVDMLDLSRPLPGYGPEEAILHPRKRVDGMHWRPDPASPVLLLGDSFTRIYSAPDLHWGRDSGLAERLSDHLGRDIDVLAINAGGSSSVRQSLARSPERLLGKKAVVYEFSMRDLSGGDWKVIPLPHPVKSQSPAPVAGEVSVTGTVVEVSEIPPPGANPYRDFVRSLRLRAGEGSDVRDMLVFVQAVRDKISTGAESLRPGDRVTFRLVPWANVEERFGSLNRSELQGPSADLPDVYWSVDY